MLEQVGTHNRFSKKFRDELEARIASFGDSVQYKFDIGSENPDPQKYNGPTIWPFQHTLDPCTFRVKDKYEDRPTEQQMKHVGIPRGAVDEKGNPTDYITVKVHERQKGVLTLNLKDNPDDLELCALLELHPKLKGGLFSDPSKRQYVTRIDHAQLAKAKREERTARTAALNIAEEMSDQDIAQFADAMLWINEDISILREKVADLAETKPVYFSDLVKTKKVEYQATIKQAMDRNILGFDPTDYKFIWASNNQTIATLQPVGDKNEVEKLAEFFMTGGNKAEEAYKKVKSLVATK